MLFLMANAKWKWHSLLRSGKRTDSILGQLDYSQYTTIEPFIARGMVKYQLRYGNSLLKVLSNKNNRGRNTVVSIYRSSFKLG